MSKSPRKAAPKRPAAAAEPTFAGVPGATITGAAHAAHAALDAAMGLATGRATLAASAADHPAIRPHDAPAPIPFCQQLTVIRCRGGFILLATNPDSPTRDHGPEDAIAVASTRAGLAACIQAWACTPEPTRGGGDIPY